jgi:hypothetical protein
MHSVFTREGVGLQFADHLASAYIHSGLPIRIRV